MKIIKTTAAPAHLSIEDAITAGHKFLEDSGLEIPKLDANFQNGGMLHLVKIDGEVTVVVDLQRHPSGEVTLSKIVVTAGTDTLFKLWGAPTRKIDISKPWSYLASWLLKQSRNPVDVDINQKYDDYEAALDKANNTIQALKKALK